MFIVYLWWRYNDWFIEDHDIVFVVAWSQNEAKNIASKKTKLKKNGLHCDWIVEINSVDWYTINLVKTNNDDVIYNKNYQKL